MYNLYQDFHFPKIFDAQIYMKITKLFTQLKVLKN